MSEPLTVGIRDLEPGDHEQWAELWRIYLEFYRQDLAPDVSARLWVRLTGSARHPQMGGIAAVSDGRLLGIAHYIVGPSTWSLADDCYLEDLVVAPETRGRGVGRALIEELVSRGRAAGWRRVFWVTDEGNATARRLYDAVGTLTEYVQYEKVLDA